MEEEEHWYGDPDAPDVGIWDARFNVGKKKKKGQHPRAKSTLDHHDHSSYIHPFKKKHGIDNTSSSTPQPPSDHATPPSKPQLFPK